VIVRGEKCIHLSIWSIFSRGHVGHYDPQSARDHVLITMITPSDTSQHGLHVPTPRSPLPIRPCVVVAAVVAVVLVAAAMVAGSCLLTARNARAGTIRSVGIALHCNRSVIRDQPASQWQALLS